MPDLIRLSDLARGNACTIVSVETFELQVALMNLGVLEGDSCILSDIAPLGDPVALKVNSSKISIRKKDAALIWVNCSES